MKIVVSDPVFLPEEYRKRASKNEKKFNPDKYCQGKSS